MLILGIAACGDMYDVHEKYLKMGEETYLGIASDLEANSGFNRIELKWKLNADQIRFVRLMGRMRNSNRGTHLCRP